MAFHAAPKVILIDINRLLEPSLRRLLYIKPPHSLCHFLNSANINPNTKPVKAPSPKTANITLTLLVP
jgi:hypothetical protein